MDEEMSALHKKVAKNKKRNQSKQNQHWPKRRNWIWWMVNKSGWLKLAVNRLKETWTRWYKLWTGRKMLELEWIGSEPAKQLRSELAESTWVDPNEIRWIGSSRFRWNPYQWVGLTQLDSIWTYCWMGLAELVY
jgi:hypothetical protein